MAFLVAFKENLRSDNAVFRDNERTGIWDTAHGFRGVLVANTVSIDRLAAGVGQERVSDGASCREPFEDIGGIVTDSYNLATGPIDFLKVRLQLDQLLFAVGSPIRRAIKNQRHGALLEQ